MAENLKPSHLLIIFLAFSLLTISTSTAAELSPLDLEAAIFALRANGFDLFGNSIAVSDLSLQVLTHTFNSTSVNGGGGSVGRHGFTFLAPPNSVLFSLDMSTDAFTYVHSLRFHVVPRRLSFAELRNISHSSKPHLETLVRGHNLFVSSRRRTVSIDGVRVSFPDLYLSSDIAVHGLDGILISSNEEFYHRLDSVASPPSIHTLTPTPAPSIDTFSPRIKPIDALSSRNEAIDALSPSFVGIPPFSLEFDGVPPYPPEFGGIPPYFHHFEGIPEDMSPIGAFSPEFGAIPPSHDAPIAGGIFDSISLPPIVAYPPKIDGISATSPESDRRIPAIPPSTEFFSSDARSISPTHAEWSGAETWLPDWNALPPPPPFPVEEWQEYWDKINNHKKSKTKTKTKRETKTKKQVQTRKKNKHHLERGHRYGEMYAEYYRDLEEREF